MPNVGLNWGGITVVLMTRQHYSQTLALLNGCDDVPVSKKGYSRCNVAVTLAQRQSGLDRLQIVMPKQMGFFFSSRQLTNEQNRKIQFVEINSRQRA
jgi:hypothetical protein